MTILDQLADYARVRTEQAKKRMPPEEIRRQALSLPKGTFAFENALKKLGISFICECKKASPSKGLIALDFPYLEIAKEYESAGADCISVLTEPKWFLGSDEYLKEITKTVSIPCLRKDFTVDEYMIYEAKVLGASVVLLICSILTEKELQGCYEIGPVFPNVKKCTAAAAVNCWNGKVWAMPEKMGHDAASPGNQSMRLYRSRAAGFHHENRRPMRKVGADAYKFPCADAFVYGGAVR